MSMTAINIHHTSSCPASGNIMSGGSVVVVYSNVAMVIVHDCDDDGGGSGAGAGAGGDDG